MGKVEKYYTPSIEEFHVGFECQEKLKHESLWNERILGLENNLDWLSREIEAGFIRVKHLDQEDIESFGWVHDENECYYDGNWGDIALYHSDGERKVRIVAYPHSPIKSSILFNGTIRNKSELKRVLIQIGVI